MSTRTPLKSILSNLVILALSIGGLGATGFAYAAGHNSECPVGLVTSVDTNGVEHRVGYVTAGITALADFQQRGYEYVQP
jgi:intracellular sulfur oxidation DsrE/DsrF family protein